MSDEIRLLVHSPELSQIEERVLNRVEALTTSYLVEKAHSLIEGWQKLLDGEVDLFAIRGTDWHDARPSEVEVVGALPRLDPHSVIVSSDRLDYLPKSAIVVCQSDLLRRQLRRYRKDLRVLSPKAWAGISETTFPKEVARGSVSSLMEWLEPQRESGLIDGYTIPKTAWPNSGLKGRRHTLGSEEGKDGQPRFLPAPLSGHILLIARKGFPSRLVDEINDTDSFIAWDLEERLLRGIIFEHIPFVGMLVRFRRLGTILREAEQGADVQTFDATVDLDGKVKAGGRRVELLIELLGQKGKVTAGIERTTLPENAHTATTMMMREWSALIESMQSPQPADKRLGEARGPFLNI